MDLSTFRARKHSVSLPQGDVAYADIGEGPAALFVHGVFMNGFLWRNVITEVAEERRCIAVDLPSHGDTNVSLDFGFSLEEHADLLTDFLDKLAIDKFDLIGNDTGGAIAQMIAARHPERLRTLTLTNCDVQDNFPPDDFQYAIDFAREGQLAPLIAQIASDFDMARSEQGLGVGYEHPENITQEMVDAFLGRYRDPKAGREIEKRIAAVAEDSLIKIEDQMRALEVPTLVVWATADNFFDIKWAHWLQENVPGVTEVIEIEGGKLFFVDERGSELAAHLKQHWAAHPEAYVASGAASEA